MNITNSCYSDKVRDCFSRPRHLGIASRVDASGEAGNQICGDSVKFTLKLANDRIIEVKWQSQGCLFSIACSEQLARLINGKMIEDADRIQFEDVVNALSWVPDGKQHCAEMAVNAFQNALHPEKAKIGARLLISPSMVLQLQHKAAELIDEWCIPELKRQGFEVSLDSVDMSASKILVKCQRKSTQVVKFIQAVLETHLNKHFMVSFI